MDKTGYLSKFEDVLGTGYIGEVFKGHSKEKPDLTIAVKRIAKTHVRFRLTFDYYSDEFTALQAHCKHRNIVDLLGFSSDEQYVYVVMNYCDIGNLQTYVDNKKLLIEEKVYIMRECAEGLTYLHSLKPPVVHGDIKPQNILLNSCSGGGYLVQITDIFDQNLKSILWKKLQEDQREFQTFCAPERSVVKLPTTATDVFSLGAVFWWMLCEEEQEEEITIDAVALVRKMIIQNLEKRPNMEKLKIEFKKLGIYSAASTSVFKEREEKTSDLSKKDMELIRLFERRDKQIFYTGSAFSPKILGIMMQSTESLIEACCTYLNIKKTTQIAQWYINNDRVHHCEHIKIFETENVRIGVTESYLRLEKRGQSLHDSDIIRCVVTGDLGEDSREVTVKESPIRGQKKKYFVIPEIEILKYNFEGKIEWPSAANPIITNIRVETNVNVESESDKLFPLAVYCTYLKCQPTPIVQWYKDTVRLAGWCTENVSVFKSVNASTGEEESKLCFKDELSIGVIKCVVTNKLGEDSREINLKDMQSGDQAETKGQKSKEDSKGHHLEDKEGATDQQNLLPSQKDEQSGDKAETKGVKSHEDSEDHPMDDKEGKTDQQNQVLLQKDEQSGDRAETKGGKRHDDSEDYALEDKAGVTAQQSLLPSQNDSTQLQILADQIEKLLHNEKSFLGLQCHQEIVVVDIYKDDFERLEKHVKENLTEESFQKVFCIEQEEKWSALAGGALGLQCKYKREHKQAGTLAALAKIKKKGGEEKWSILTCKHVLSSASPDLDEMTEVHIKLPNNEDGVNITSPNVYTVFKGTPKTYFADAALLEIDDEHKNEVLSNNNLPMKLKHYCKNGGCKHIHEGTEVEKTGIKTDLTKGKIHYLQYRAANLFDEYKGIVCLVIGIKETDFNDQGDSGSLVLTDDGKCAIGLVSSHIKKFKYIGKDYVERVGHATCIVYLDECIKSLKSEHSDSIDEVEIWYRKSDNPLQLCCN